MSDTRSVDFLVELGTEELPPKALKTLRDAFRNSVDVQLEEAGLSYQSLQAYASPRRLAIQILGLDARQSDRQQEKLGPAVAAAKDNDGNPTKAALGFARGCGVEFDALETTHDGKAERLVFRSTIHGETASILLPGMVETALQQLPVPKRMRWGAHRFEFVRPVHWLVMLLDGDVLDAEVLGIRSGRETRGHRFHGEARFDLQQADDYVEPLLKQGWVMVNYEDRRQTIEQQVQQAGEQLGGQAVIEADLLDEVTALVEWPVALAGSFEERFLNIPAQALISSMKEHQKYFHVVDGKGELMPYFITVSNIESQDPAKIIAGNERVIRPRLSDAAFFYETDCKRSLESLLPRLDRIVFQNKLGSVGDKARRVEKLAVQLGKHIGADLAHVERAARLSKADLVTEMVGEFDDMQGIAGAAYALNDGEEANVARALEEQYWPRFAGDRLPGEATGICIALADRLDTIVGIFGIGQKPTGSKDPFALRRASLGVLRIMIDKKLDLDLKQCIQYAVDAHNELPAAAGLTDTVFDYITERLRSLYQEQGIRFEVFAAVMGVNPSHPLDIDQRVNAVQAFAGLPEAEALASANKRVMNLLAKAPAELDSRVQEELLSQDEEQELLQRINELGEQSDQYIQQADYAAALKTLAGLKTTVDRFFDAVMVMCDDEAIRNNRLSLLKLLAERFLKIADVSQLASQRG